MVTKKRNKAQQLSDETRFSMSIRRTAVSLAVAAALPGAMVLPTAAMAQDAAAQDDVIEEVVSYGKFRQSLIDSIGTKRDSSTIVEAISAEDIGKLPDSSIAESLARLPGLAGERVNGRTSDISVRGFKGDYSGVSLNGRELLGIGDNRNVEYDLYPSEIISGVLVYKAPDATMTTQGIAGIVDLRTARPLDEESYLVINANYESNDLSSPNPDFDDTGHRLALSYSDTFADDTVGLAVAFATTESPSQEVQFRGWGYADVGCDDMGNFNNATDATGGSLSCGDKVLGGHDSFVRSGILERDTVSAVLQFAPNDDVTVTLDALFIDYTEDKVFRGIEDGGPEWGGTAYTVTGVENGFVTSGFYEGFLSVIRNDAERKDAELTTFGLNVEYDLNDDWSLTFDAALSESDKRVTNIESYSGLGRAGLDSQGAPTPRSWTMSPTGAVYGNHPTLAPVDLSDFNVIRLAGPQAWGGGMQNLPEFADTTGPNGETIGPFQAQDGFINEPIFDEELTTIKLTAERALEVGILSGVEFGVYYSDRSKSKDNGGYYLTAPTWPGDGEIPTDARFGVTDLSVFGLGTMVAYDGLGMFQSGFYTSSDAAILQPDREGDSYTIDEQLTSVFAKVDFDTNIGDVVVNGNFGVQIVSADQKGTGLNAAIGPSGFVETTDASDGDDYTDVLPSFNINFEVADGHILRSALSKTISRPRMDQMKPNGQVNFNFNAGNVASTDPEAGPWSASLGNARLKPLEANQFDLAYDWYFADDGFVSAAFFYKDLTNWHADGSFFADFTDFYIPGYHEAIVEEPPGSGNFVTITPGTFQGVVSAKADGLEGFVRGWELQGNLPFHKVSEALDGLGLIASVASYEGELDGGQSVPGLSKRSFQSTLYYERGGFQARVSWTKRSAFATETPQLSLALTPAVDQGAELIDAQIGFDFGLAGIDALDGLYVSLQGQNLTDEDTLQTDSDPRQVTKYQTFGANYLLNVNYRFK
jgi:iron complex outermembrane receptor protein